jgi:hypothetical protein
MSLLHLYRKGKRSTYIGIVKGSLLSRAYEQLFAIDKKCREELYIDIPNVLKHGSKANSIDETHSISSDNNSKTMKFHVTVPY